MSNEMRSFGLLVSAVALATALGCRRGESAPEQNPIVVPEGVGQTAKNAPAGQAAAGMFNPRLLRRFKPIRASFERGSDIPNQEQVALGRMLYYETRLSKNNDLSCNSCHDLANYGVDGEATSKGFEGQRGGRNSPTVYHAAGALAQFWDGRAASVEEQAKGPITNPIEMGMADGAAAVKALQAIPDYRKHFAKAFPAEREPLTYDNIGRAIGAFERSLVTPARWDKYLEGDVAALTAREVEGLRIFTNVGCMVCHTGELLGGSSYQKVGAVEPWPNQSDQGRYQATKIETDRMSFKVPTLRNIEKTAPYFHDGSAKTLGDAVRMMGRHQLGLDLSHEEVAAIETWLKSLTGKLPTDYIAKPALPGENEVQQAGG